MAKRRCICIDVYESEKYLDLSYKAQVLYTHYVLRCDDEGVVINPRSIMRLCGACTENLQELIDEGFLLSVKDVFVVKHWYVHNRIQPSKKTDSLYRNELSQLCVNERKEYEFIEG